MAWRVTHSTIKQPVTGTKGPLPPTSSEGSTPARTQPQGLEGACKGHPGPNKPSEAVAEPPERCQLCCH